MKKKLVLTFFLAFFLFITRVSFAQGDTAGEHIKNFKTEIVVNRDATISVRETILYDFGNLQRHGIFREIPYVKTNKNGERFKLDIDINSVTDENGAPYRYKTTREDEMLKLKIGDPDRTVTGKRTYVIGYKVSGAITYFSDHDELYWNAVGTEWDVPVESVFAIVALTEAVSGSQIKLACYTGPERSNYSDCSFETQGANSYFTTTKKLKGKEGLTIVAGFPKGIVAVLEPKPYVLFWDTSFGIVLKRFLQFILILAAIFWYLLYPVWIIYKWFAYGRDPSTRRFAPRSGQAPSTDSEQAPSTDSGQALSGEVRAWYDPPKTAAGRSLTPAETGALIDETADQEDVSSALVDLARRGYLKIEERAKKDFYIIRQKEFAKDTTLMPFEKKLLDGIFSENDEFRIKGSNLSTEINNVKNEIYKSVVLEGFFPENPNKIRTFYFAIAGLASATLNVHLALIAFLFGRHMPRKTTLGVAAANIAKSLKNFLSSQERQLEFQAKNQMMFEKFLPYAVAFRVEKVWAKRFESIHLKPPEWYSSYDSSGSFNSVIFTNSLNSSFSSLRSAATPTSSSSGFGSGFSGGSSGGGGGGGGGGSW